LKAKGTTASRTGDVVTLTVPVGEGGVKEQVVRLKADGSFIGKSTVAVDGTVLTSTEVLTSGIDRGTGLSFPISWAMVEGGSRGTIFLTATAINQGVPAARFATTVPAGYTERTP
jgi:outer membrane lipoprotein-sorting protein